MSAIVVDGFAGGGAFSNRIEHQFRGIVALHRKECRVGLEPFLVPVDKILHGRGGLSTKKPSTNTAPSIDESSVRAKSGEFHPFAPRKGTFMSWKLSWAVMRPASAARPGMKIASKPGV